MFEVTVGYPGIVFFSSVFGEIILSFFADPAIIVLFLASMLLLFVRYS